MDRNLGDSLRYAVLWLAVVAVTSALAWVAIGRSGRELAAIDTPTTAAPNLPSGAGSTPGPSAPTSTASASPSAPSATGGTQRTLTTAGGRVTVRCRGASLEFRAAMPADGWAIQGPNLEDNALELKFVADDGREIEVSGTCRAGEPTVTAHGD